MAITPNEPVAAPDPGPLRYGLFTASPPGELPARAVGGGVTYDLDHCGTAQNTIVECVAAAGSTDDKSFAQGIGQSAADPFAVYGGVQCGPVGYDFSEFEDKARATLTAGEQGAAERALWAGTDGSGDALGIDAFNNSAPTGLTPTDDADIASVISALEEFAYLTSGYGYRAYIHAPVSVAAYAGTDVVVPGADGRLYTPFGSVWVFGGGYSGTDSGGTVPAGGTAVYVTGAVNVWRSDVVIPDLTRTLDRDTNQQYVLAERVYAASFDCLLGEATFIFPAGGS